ncbi:HtaA domain-containing protein [Actinacidiphila sp. ITFR-21]|uniref:HtaA domain-containing protein n=1 Tax=Actinacidiphila sp. ITFR-21 TaxID=3075199 RepID=UPI002889F955|nr:HtaA domain-containing protein [Streptomyces sp. ITFR-21]WNI15280.1 HtaA domain-containing protein [Streptomyces sp. ITFR-21]
MSLSRRAQRARRARSRVGAAVAAVLTAVAGLALLPAGAAHAAAGRTVEGGRLDWGIKASFQSYVTGPIARGSWSLTGSAGTIGSDQFRFPSAQGAYQPGSGALTAAFQGGVHFVGHREDDGTYQLDLTVSRPTIRISGHTGTLYADMRGRDKDTGKVTTDYQVPLAALSLGGLSTAGVTGPRLVLSGVPATLTAQGARSFAGYYTAGTRLDPVSVSVDLHDPPATTGTPAPSKTTPPSSSSSPSSPPTRHTAPGTVVDAAVDWGVRRTFREYVTGDIAKGRWVLADGARDGGTLFRFGAGRGTYTAEKHTLDAHFGGSVRFLGMRGADGTYGLDLTIRAVRVTVGGGKGTLYADGRPLATFTAPAVLTPGNGLISIEGAPTELTAQGAELFDGLYTAGTPMDPLNLSVALDRKAALPALPDIGSGPTGPEDTPAARTTAPAAPSARPTEPPRAASAGSGTPAGALTAGAIAVLAAAGLITAAVVVRRRRRTPTD